MGAEKPAHWKVGEKEAAKKVGCFSSMIQRIATKPREAFLQRSKSRGKQALALVSSGINYREISEKLVCSTRPSNSLVHRARV